MADETPKSISSIPLFYLVLVVATAILAGFTGAPLRTTLTLAWDYPENSADTNLAFNLYQSPVVNQPATNWTLLTTVYWPTQTCVVPVLASNGFYFVTASNLTGESGPSPFLPAPALVTNTVNLRVK